LNSRGGLHLSDVATSDAHAWYRAEQRNTDLRIELGGSWVTDEAALLDKKLRTLNVGGVRVVEFDGSQIHRLDSTGAWLLVRTRRQLEEAGVAVRSFTFPKIYEPLIQTLERGGGIRRTPPPPPSSFVDFLERVGRGTLAAGNQGYHMLGFLGRVTVETSEAVIRPDRELPWPSFINQIEETGFTALPILGLLSFLLGVVLAYQGANQLARFGAEVLTVNLVGAAILREVGGLITAIIVAGRSGSAFTAQIGTMKLNQEIDAMQTIGLNTVEILVLPRVLGLLVAMPLLTFYANVMGLAGGAVMCYFDLGITVQAYLRQLHESIPVHSWTFWLGLIKAPVFAVIIALVGCFEGLRVEGDAGSVGRLTTRSVVESIFIVIVFDAAFSIIFSLMNI
jgi:phospholipid/cholesterol/gamma-HCH transport system permease protein